MGQYMGQIRPAYDEPIPFVVASDTLSAALRSQIQALDEMQEQAFNGPRQDLPMYRLLKRVSDELIRIHKDIDLYSKPSYTNNSQSQD